jgi:hypothetical protein
LAPKGYKERKKWTDASKGTLVMNSRRYAETSCLQLPLQSLVVSLTAFGEQFISFGFFAFLVRFCGQPNS